MLGSLILYLKGMRVIVFQLYGIYLMPSSSTSSIPSVDSMTRKESRNGRTQNSSQLQTRNEQLSINRMTLWEAVALVYGIATTKGTSSPKGQVMDMESSGKAT